MEVFQEVFAEKYRKPFNLLGVLVPRHFESDNTDKSLEAAVSPLLY